MFDDDIYLKRLDQKVWQFKDNAPTRVELAVLEYLKDQGFSGYFTEHFNYENTLLGMMCWCNRDSYFTEKRKSLAVNRISDAFDYAQDGFYTSPPFKTHKFYHSDLFHNAEMFTSEKIKEILTVWQRKNVKSDFCGRRYLKPRPASDLSADELISFYYAKGGKDYFLSYLEHFFNSEVQALKKRSRDSIELLYQNPSDNLDVLRTDLWSSSLHLFQCLSKGTRVAWDQSNHHLDELNSKISAVPDVKIRDDLFSLARDISDYILTKSDGIDRWLIYSVLDLEVWDSQGVASVEVKAPRDRLSVSQKKQLEADVKYNKRSWVIYVHEST